MMKALVQVGLEGTEGRKVRSGHGCEASQKARPLATSAEPSFATGYITGLETAGRIGEPPRTSSPPRSNRNQTKTNAWLAFTELNRGLILNGCMELKHADLQRPLSLP